MAKVSYACVQASLAMSPLCHMLESLKPVHACMSLQVLQLDLSPASRAFQPLRIWIRFPYFWKLDTIWERLAQKSAQKTEYCPRYDPVKLLKALAL